MHRGSPDRQQQLFEKSDCKRTRFPRKTNIFSTKAVDEVPGSINGLIERWSRKVDVELNHWWNVFKEKVEEKARFLKTNTKFSNKKCRSLFARNDVKQELARLHEHYVLVPIDKAAKNVAFVCKRFYIEVLFRELGLMGNTANATYSRAGRSLETLVQEHMKAFSKYGISTPNETQQKLPFLYWIPKFHKNPIKFRFIAASFCCTSKPLSATFTICLKEVQRMLSQYCRRIHFATSINQMWIAENSEAVMKNLAKINRKNNAKTIATYDFSTLYTSIPHDALIEAIRCCIERAFRGGFGKYLVVRGKTCSWSRKAHRNRPSFSLEQLQEMTKLLIENIYFKVGSIVFRQNIGIPMGTDCAPFMANMFLHHYEAKFITSNRPRKWHTCKLLSHNKRYIDDMLVLNAGHVFEQVKDEIYPKELVLNKENQEDFAGHFLDLDIKIQNKRFCVKLFDKRDAFRFAIVNFPFLDGNIPERIGSSVIISQLVRFSKCTFAEDFFAVAGKLLRKVQNQFFSKRLIARAVKRFAQNHFDLVAKYGIHKRIVVSSLLST